MHFTIHHSKRQVMACLVILLLQDSLVLCLLAEANVAQGTLSA